MQIRAPAPHARFVICGLALRNEHAVYKSVFHNLSPFVCDYQERAAQNLHAPTESHLPDDCIREIAKQSSDLANIIVHYGGPGAIVDYLNHTSGTFKLPGIMTLGFVAGFDESLAMAVIVSEGIPPLCEALGPGNEDHVKAAAAWSLGQIGRHSPQHAKPLCDKNVPATLLAVTRVK